MKIHSVIMKASLQRFLNADKTLAESYLVPASRKVDLMHSIPAPAAPVKSKKARFVRVRASRGRQPPDSVTPCEP
jgi:hypothetical protein